MAANLKIDSLNPRNGEVVGSFKPTEPEDIPLFVEKARAVSVEWQNQALGQRKKIIKSAYKKFYENKEELAELISKETGKPVAEAFTNEIFTTLDCFKFYLKNINSYLRPEKVSAVNPLLKLRAGRVNYEPLGVLAVISPWNYPLLLSMQHIIPALLCGNGIVFKPSEFTTLVGLKIGELFKQAALPDELFTVVTGLADVGTALVNSKVDKIFFTGSTAVGKKIYAAAAQNLTPVNMELGGSDAMVVFADANIERATNAAVWGTFTNAGQACVSIERILVEDSLKEQFVQKLSEKIKMLSFTTNGAAEDEVSCLINKVQFQKVHEFVKDARNKGANVLFGGNSRTDIGELVFEPTLISEVNDTMEITRNEIFGPLAILDTFKTYNEALEKVNKSDFGLSASVWTTDIKKGREFASRIVAGSIIINDTHIHLGQFEAPYSGYKNSGLGVSHGKWGIAEMVRPKYTNFDRPLLGQLVKWVNRSLYENDIWWYKYNKRRYGDFRSFARFLHGSLMERIASLLLVIKALFRRDYL